MSSKFNRLRELVIKLEIMNSITSQLAAMTPNLVLVFCGWLFTNMNCRDWVRALLLFDV